jgi:processing peptidase subunit alpha
MTTSLHDIGSTVLNSTQRDFSFSSALTFPSKLPLALSLLSSSLTEPLLLPKDLEEARQAAAYESSLSFAKASIIMPDLVHSTAYSGKTLGMPTICPESQLENIGERELRGYINDWIKPERIVVAGLGMPHEDLVEMVEKEFSHLSGVTTANTSAATASLPGALGRVTSAVASGSGSGSGQGWWGKTFATVSNAQEPEVPLESDYNELALAKAVYTGGERYVDKPDEDFCNLSITFESPHITDDDIVSQHLRCSVPYHHIHSSGPPCTYRPPAKPLSYQSE